MPNARLIIVSGLSGSGKSHVIRSLEDLGYYCIDNLPIPLLGKFIDLCKQSRSRIQRSVLGIDIREGEFLSEFLSLYDALREEGYPAELLFVEARDEVLLRRFSETRRPHPLAQAGHEGSVLEGIGLERERLAELRRRADRILDTSDYHVHELKQVIGHDYAEGSGGGLAISLVSFGYKFGVPTDVDLMFDVRFLSNPHFDPALRHLTGEDPRVVESVLASSSSGAFISKLHGMIDFLLPLYEKEGKSYLTIGIGCTGGRHRSVAIVRLLEDHIKMGGREVHCRHRDVAK
jgi:UPF0042 nucleotide-binding protein